jgi:hypothetical protein
MSNEISLQAIGSRRALRPGWQPRYPCGGSPAGRHHPRADICIDERAYELAEAVHRTKARRVLVGSLMDLQLRPIGGPYQAAAGSTRRVASTSSGDVGSSPVSDTVVVGSAEHVTS